jgi:hypothetical protein
MSVGFDGVKAQFAVIGAVSNKPFNCGIKCFHSKKQYMHNFAELKPHLSCLCFVVDRQNGLPDCTHFAAYFHHSLVDILDFMKKTEQLSRQAIDEFKAIYQEEFGETLNDDEVQEIAQRLLRFFGILNDPNPDKTGPSLT